jgi:HK97 gp10 family phage protein
MSMHVEFEQSGGMAPFSFTAAALRWTASVNPVVTGAIRAKAPVGKGPGAGNLRRSVTSRRKASGASVSQEFGATAAYTRFVVDGTRPHMIAARGARALRFTTPGGQVLFRRSVNHPGTKPNPFAREAVTSVLPAVRATFDTIMREAMGGIK